LVIQLWYYKYFGPYRMWITRRLSSLGCIRSNFWLHSISFISWRSFLRSK